MKKLIFFFSFFAFISFILPSQQLEVSNVQNTKKSTNFGIAIGMSQFFLGLGAQAHLEAINLGNSGVVFECQGGYRFIGTQTVGGNVDSGNYNALNFVPGLSGLFAKAAIGIPLVREEIVETNGWRISREVQNDGYWKTITETYMPFEAPVLRSKMAVIGIWYDPSGKPSTYFSDDWYDHDEYVGVTDEYNIYVNFLYRKMRYENYILRVDGNDYVHRFMFNWEVGPMVSIDFNQIGIVAGVNTDISINKRYDFCFRTTYGALVRLDTIGYEENLEDSGLKLYCPISIMFGISSNH